MRFLAASSTPSRTGVVPRPLRFLRLHANVFVNRRPGMAFFLRVSAVRRAWASLSMACGIYLMPIFDGTMKSQRPLSWFSTVPMPGSFTKQATGITLSADFRLTRLGADFQHLDDNGMWTLPAANCCPTKVHLDLHQLDQVRCDP